MLGHGYLKIGMYTGGSWVYSTLPNPIAITENFNNVENTAMSEGGMDLVNVIRLQKRSFDMTFQLSSSWLDTIKNFAMLSENRIQLRGETINVRTRINSAVLAPNSEYSSESDGYYTVALNFTEI